MLSAIKSVGLALGKLLLGSALGVVSKDTPPHLMGMDTLIQMAQAIAHQEIAATAYPLTGEQKRLMAARVIEQLILRSAIGHGKKLHDPAKFRAAVEHMTGDFADVLNSFKSDAVETKDVS